MRACDVARQALARLVAISCLFSAGCMVPYAYPHLSCVPPLATGARHDEVRAFRVDVTGDILDTAETDAFLLDPVALSQADRTPAQARLTLDYGYYVLGIALNYPVHHGHSTLLRLYQPGYRLVEAYAWDLPGKIDWQAAEDLEAQDCLLRAPSIEAPRIEFSYGREPLLRASSWNARSLCPGSTAPGHREALLFAASEYERLAALVDLNENVAQARKERLLRKASDVRERASE